MREKLERLLDNSYAKYSNYRVACICVMNDGREIVGVNVENASYGATICAERVAITGAVARGYKKGDFRELHVMVDSDKLGTPCFMCRQVITEFFSNNDKIYVYSRNEQKEFLVSELCPYPFGEDDLK
jgi:cytidine deaminase